MKHILLALSFLLTLSAFGQKKNTTPIPPAAPALSPIEAKVAGMKKYAGYFEFYYDDKQDKIFLVIDKFETEFLYVCLLYTSDAADE